MTTRWANNGQAPVSKEVQTPAETIRLAIAANGDPVLYSKGHTLASARSKAKRIRKGRPHVWAQWEGQFRTGSYKQPDGTWSVFVGWIGGDENGQGATGPAMPWHEDLEPECDHPNGHGTAGCPCGAPAPDRDEEND